MSIKTIEAGYDVSEAQFAIVAGRWHDIVVDGLLEGAIACLKKHGVNENEITVFRAPGAVEIPLVAKQIAQTQKFDAIITLGAVIRGGTPHFEYVSNVVSNGSMQVMLETDTPVTFGILTVDNMEQALERAGAVPDSPIGHKGEEAALSALEMVNLLKMI